ncbi:unnamed protein product [Rhizophagus irregularis]|nr:unnamed protein product [Rhizophagus irregularis]
MTPFASNIINTPISEKQKRILLFNVNQPLELSIEEFDKEWWPLVSNIWTGGFSCKNNVNGDSWKVFVCRFKKHNKSSTQKEGIPNEKYLPDHSHPIEDSEKLKRSEVVRELVMQEAVKNYRPPEIISAVKEIATKTLNLGECVKELRRKEVTNIKYKVRGPLDTHLVGDPKKELDIREAISFLKNRDTWLNVMKFLTYSIHKTNRYDCRLFTLYIHNSYGCWDVGAHFFVSKEDSETVATGLKAIRRFAHCWNPRYFLSDQSNIESNAIKMAFPGLKNGEQECDVFFCTVHVMRTWMSKIYEKKT